MGEGLRVPVRGGEGGQAATGQCQEMLARHWASPTSHEMWVAPCIQAAYIGAVTSTVVCSLFVFICTCIMIKLSICSSAASSSVDPDSLKGTLDSLVRV